MIYNSALYILESASVSSATVGAQRMAKQRMGHPSASRKLHRACGRQTIILDTLSMSLQDEAPQTSSAPKQELWLLTSPSGYAARDDLSTVGWTAGTGGAALTMSRCARRKVIDQPHIFHDHVHPDTSVPTSA